MSGKNFGFINKSYFSSNIYLDIKSPWWSLARSSTFITTSKLTKSNPKHEIEVLYHCVPNKLLYGELHAGKLLQGVQKKRYKDIDGITETLLY
jgi:hypothetical protein